MASKILNKSELDSRFSTYRQDWIKSLLIRGLDIALIESPKFLNLPLPNLPLSHREIYAICQQELSNLLSVHPTQITIHDYVDCREIGKGRLYIAFILFTP